MRKLSIIIAVCALVSSLFAVDSVRVIRGGDLVKTSSPIFNEITATTANYTYTGTVTANKLVATTNAVLGAASCTSLTNTGITTIGTIIIPAATVTAAATSVTANFSIPVTINGVACSVLLRI